MKKYLALGLESSEPEETRKTERVRAEEDAERMRQLEETEKHLRMLSMAAERAAGRIRAMEWKEYQAMVVGLAHAAAAIGRVAQKAENEGTLLMKSMAMGDRDALVRALRVLGWNEGTGGRVN